MHLREPLTKENFWNKLYSEYPEQTKVFCDWIDEYKNAVNWAGLFNEHAAFGTKYSAPKFDDLPYALQVGIWIEFVSQNGGSFLDIENVFELSLGVAIKDFIKGKI